MNGHPVDSAPERNGEWSRFDLNPLSAALGAEITGIDLATVDDATLDDIRRAYRDHGVVFFRDQSLTPEQHITFAERLGTINVNRFFNRVDGYPVIAEVRKEPGQERNIGGLWHTDHSYDAAPAMGSILYCREAPAVGGDTLFASMYRTFETLSAGLKETLRGLRAVHSSRHVFGVERASVDAAGLARFNNAQLATQDAVHPVVIRHPLSGRPALYVNPDFTVRIDGWTDDESRPLLDYLYRHAARAEFTCRFRWRPGSVAFWDNRATWHMALNDYHGHRRLMHRITLEGETLGAW